MYTFCVIVSFKLFNFSHLSLIDISEWSTIDQLSFFLLIENLKHALKNIPSNQFINNLDKKIKTLNILKGLDNIYRIDTS